MEAEVKSLRRAEIRLPGSELTSSHSCPWEELGDSSTLVCCWWHTPSTRSPVYNGYRSRQAPSEFLFLSSELKSLLSTQASIDPWPLYLVPSWLQEDSLSCPGLVYISLVQGGGREGVVILMYGLGPHWFSLQYSSVTQLCPTPCDPMNCRTPGFPVHHQLPEPTQIPVHHTWWCHPTISSSVVPFFSHRQSFPASGSFPMSQLFTSGGQSIGVWASTSVLSMNIQDWFPLGWTAWISLQSRGLSSLLQHHSSKASVLPLSAFLIVQLSHPYITTGKIIALTRQTFVGKAMTLLYNMLSRFSLIGALSVYLYFWLRFFS